MKRTPRNILRHEIIGLEAEVIRSTNPSLEGIKGIIIDETKYTIVLKTARGWKRVLKHLVVLRMVLPGGKRVIIEGKYLVGRPEDRLKRRLRYW